MPSTDTRYIPMPPTLIDPLHGRGPSLARLVGAAIPRKGKEADAIIGRMMNGAAITLADSGTSALVLALRAGRIGPGNEVIVPTFNCPQVIDAVIRVGAVPVLCDVDRNSGVATSATASAALTHRTRGLIVTHQFGVLHHESIELASWGRGADLVVIDDAAQAFGCQLDGHVAGGLGNFGVLSFGPSKPLNAGGGGALVGEEVGGLLPGRPAAAEWRAAAASAVMRYPGVRQAIRRPAPRARFSDVRSALEAKPTEVQEPTGMDGWKQQLLLLQAAQWPAITASRSDRIQRLSSFVNSGGIELMQRDDESSNHAYAWLRVPADKRFDLGTSLSRAGYQCSWYHLPLHRITRYSRYAAVAVAGSEALWPTILQVPCRGLSFPRLERLGRLLWSHDHA